MYDVNPTLRLLRLVGLDVAEDTPSWVAEPEALEAALPGLPKALYNVACSVLADIQENVAPPDVAVEADARVIAALIRAHNRADPADAELLFDLISERVAGLSELLTHLSDVI